MDGRLCTAPTCEDEMTYRLDPTFTIEEQGAIRNAMRIWERGTGGRICFLQTSKPAFRVAIVRAEDPVVLRPVDPDWEKHAGLYRLGTIWIVTKDNDLKTITDITAHELGHAMGLKHTSLSGSIMRGNEGARQWDGELPESDRVAFCDLFTCACR
jgi:hypothetical protein